VQKSRVALQQERGPLSGLRVELEHAQFLLAAAGCCHAGSPCNGFFA
jgi:hypothetical protein